MCKSSVLETAVYPRLCTDDVTPRPPNAHMQHSPAVCSQPNPAPKTRPNHTQSKTTTYEALHPVAQDYSANKRGTASPVAPSNVLVRQKKQPIGCCYCCMHNKAASTHRRKPHHTPTSTQMGAHCLPGSITAWPQSQCMRHRYTLYRLNASNTNTLRCRPGNQLQQGKQTRSEGEGE